MYSQSAFINLASQTPRSVADVIQVLPELIAQARALPHRDELSLLQPHRPLPHTTGTVFAAHLSEGAIVLYMPIVDIVAQYWRVELSYVASSAVITTARCLDSHKEVGDPDEEDELYDHEEG
jgi:hypothetical protein